MEGQSWRCQLEIKPQTQWTVKAILCVCVCLCVRGWYVHISFFPLAACSWALGHAVILCSLGSFLLFPQSFSLNSLQWQSIQDHYFIEGNIMQFVADMCVCVLTYMCKYTMTKSVCAVTEAHAYFLKSKIRNQASHLHQPSAKEKKPSLC